MTADGLRVEGLDVDAAAQLLAAVAMRWHGRRVTWYVYGVPTDMRKGFDGLAALRREPAVRARSAERRRRRFLSRDRVRAKVLHFDGTELRTDAERLERGRFASLWREERGYP